MIKYISNIEEVREKVEKKKLPKSFILSESEKIIDVGIFIESHLTILSVKKLTRIHRPYFDRLKKVLDKLKIKITVDEKED